MEIQELPKFGIENPIKKIQQRFEIRKLNVYCIRDNQLDCDFERFIDYKDDGMALLRAEKMCRELNDIYKRADKITEQSISKNP